MRALRCLLVILVLSPLAVSHGAQKTPNRTFRAGAAASNITPPLGELIVGGWKPYPARHIHDELFAKCLVLDDGKTQIAIVLCDNVGIPREVFDAAKALIKKETGLPPSHVLTAATHTHSATTARGLSIISAEKSFSAYQRFLIRRIADGVRRAINNLEPARIGWGRAEEKSQVFNRRWHVTNKALLKNPFGGVDTVRMNPPRGDKSLLRPAGPVDPEIAFLVVESREVRPRPMGPSPFRAPKKRREEFRPIAVLANYSLHYVGGVGPGHVSSDYFGVFAGRIAEWLNAEKTDPPFVGILSNGTSGDINNINFRIRGERKKPYEKMRAVGRLVAQRVFDAHKSVKYHDWVPLAAIQKDLELKVRKPTEERLRYFENVMTDKTRKPYYVHERIYADRVKQLANSPDTVAVPLQALRIGDVGIAAIPFEVFVEIGLEIKQKSPFKRSFTIELANGSYGYLPTPAQHKLGGYETWMGTNRVEKTASDKITKSVLSLLNDVHRRDN